MSKDKLINLIIELESVADPEIKTVKKIVETKPSWLCYPGNGVSNMNLPLHVAVCHNKLSAVEVLLEFVPSLANIVDVYGSPAFFQLNRDAQALQIAGLLLSKMSDETVGIVSKEGFSFLYTAVVRDWVQIVKEVLKRAPELVSLKYGKFSILDLCRNEEIKNLIKEYTVKKITGEEPVQAAAPFEQGTMQQPMAPLNPLPRPEEPVQAAAPEPEQPIQAAEPEAHPQQPEPLPAPLEHNPLKREEPVKQAAAPEPEGPIQAAEPEAHPQQPEPLPAPLEHNPLKKEEPVKQAAASKPDLIPIKVNVIEPVTRSKPQVPLKSIEMDGKVKGFKEKFYPIKKNIFQLEGQVETFESNLSYTSAQVEQLIALQLPRGITVKTVERSAVMEDDAIIRLIESAITNGIAILLLPNGEGLILKNLGNEVLQLIHLKSDNNHDELSQDLIYGIFALSPWDISFIQLQHELPYSFEMKHAAIIENLVIIAKSKDKKKADLLKQLADPADHVYITKKHLLLQENQAHYSELKFSELLKYTLKDTGTYCGPITILNKSNDHISKYRYREKIEENLSDAISKIENDPFYSGAIVPLIIKTRDFSAIFFKKTDPLNLFITLINPRNEALQDEENFGFLSKVLYTVKGYFGRKFNYLARSIEPNNDDSGPLVISCAKLLATFKDFKSNFFKTESLFNKLSIDSVRNEHTKVICDKYEIPKFEDFLIKEVQPIGVLEKILEYN